MRKGKKIKEIEEVEEQRREVRGVGRLGGNGIERSRPMIAQLLYLVKYFIYEYSFLG